MLNLVAERPSLLKWMREEMQIGKEMLWKNPAEAQTVWWRDNVCRLFQTDDCQIVGWHKSKSILLPVYGILRPRISLCARQNFYNWNVSVCADTDINIPEYMNIDADYGYLFVEGMADHKRGMHRDNPREFSFCYWNQDQVYAALWCIASQVNHAL